MTTPPVPRGRCRLCGAASCVRRRAFTYVEVLVVIGILTLVAGILLPVIGRARSAARVAVCSSQLRQIYIAAQTWRQDHAHGLEMPAISALGWRTEFRKYLQTRDVYICPEDTIVGGVDAAAGAAPAATAGASTQPSQPSPTPPAAVPKSHGTPGDVDWDLDGLVIVVHPKSGPSFQIPFKPGPMAKVLSNTPVIDPGCPFPTVGGYILGFEDGQGATDHTDLVFSVADNSPYFLEMTLLSKNSGCTFDLLYPDFFDGYADFVNIGVPNTPWECGAIFGTLGILPPIPPDPPPTTTGDAAGPPTTGTPGFSTDSSYGVNNAANDVYGDFEKVFALDYTTSVADVVDNWLADPYAKEGNLLFARHNGRVNVLFGDGSVRLTDNPRRNLDPAVGQNTTKVWVP